MFFIHIELAQWLLMKAREFFAVYFLIDPSLSLPARGSAGGPYGNSLLHLLPTLILVVPLWRRKQTGSYKLWMQAVEVNKKAGRE